MKKLLAAICVLLLMSGCLKQQLPAGSVDKNKGVTNAIVKFYGNINDPILIYEQSPFEGGTLVLAERLMDGEHYPELHFVDSNNKVTYTTRGSYCWTLNYTQFKGNYIYFGLAGVEGRQYTENKSPVEKIEAVFSDRTVSVSPSKKIIDHINPLEKDSRVFNNPQGYIMALKGNDTPREFIAFLENGEKLPLLKTYTEYSIGHGTDYMPDYLKSEKAEIYNSLAFTFSPMLTQGELDKWSKEGQICLEGKTDGNGNINALYFKAAGHMSPADSYVIPQDIKPFYLSDNHFATTRFSPGETLSVKYPSNRELLDCRILKLTKERVEQGISQDSLALVEVDENKKLTLPRDEGYYMFTLRTREDNSIQVYVGIMLIAQEKQ